MQVHLLGKTKPLRDLVLMQATSQEKRQLLKNNLPNPAPEHFFHEQGLSEINPNALPLDGDPIRQTFVPQTSSSTIFPKRVIEGIDQDKTSVNVPDTNGDISPEHYVQIVNASWFRVFSRDGTALTDPISPNTLWSQLGKNAAGDPIILYDETAQRWFLAEMTPSSLAILFAVSETSDPLGAWNIYVFYAPTKVDYPKFGIFRDAYVMTTNTVFQDFYPVYAFNRHELLSGSAVVNIQRIDLPDVKVAFKTATPMSWLGTDLPQSDETFVVRLNDDAWGNGNTVDWLEVWDIRFKWNDPASTIATLYPLQPAPFDADGRSWGIPNTVLGCIPQPDIPVCKSAMMSIVMNKVHCRSFGTHESAVLNFTVNTSSNSERQTGIRWMELRRNPGENWVIFQEGTFAPNDLDNRFLGAISINKAGAVGLAYSVSSANTYPSLRFTGRRASDPPGQMTIDEYEFATGEASQTHERLGDYASMSVDPVDDSFWFTSQYVKSDSTSGTKIVQFSLRKDTFDLEAHALLFPESSANLSDQEAVVVQIKNIGLEPATSFSVGYLIGNNAPVIEPIGLSGPLLPDSTHVHVFSKTVDMATIGAYPFQVFTIFSQDQWLQNDTLSKAVYKLPRHDAGVTGVSGLDSFVCIGNDHIWTQIKNFGAETITSVALLFSLNNSPEKVYNLTGSLAPGANRNFPIYLNPILNGSNSFYIATSNPNGVSDEIPSNDQYTQTFSASTQGPTLVLEITFDNAPEEISWNLKDDSGQIIYYRKGYGSGHATKTVKEALCVEPDRCYTFTILDASGDGMHPVSGSTGSYRILDAGGKVLASILQTNFGFQENNPFCLDQPCVLAVEFSVTALSGAGSSDGVILLSPTSGLPPFEYSIDGGENFHSGNLFDGLEGGTYTVVVRDANGCLFESDVTVSPPLLTDNPYLRHKVIVTPNPAPDGVFFVKCEEVPKNLPTLDVQVLNAAGKPVVYSKLSRVDNYHAGIVSLFAMPGGIYFMRFVNAGIDKMIKLVRP